ncbi:MAG: dihydroneopterin aldolase [bacterium]
MDWVRLKNMTFFAYHGVRPEEANTGARFEVDVEIGGDLQRAGRSDNLKETFNYERIYRLVEKTVTGARFHLLEAIAEVIAQKILDSYPQAQVRVIVRKPHAPVPGVLDTVEVEVFRKGKRGSR